MNKEFEFFNELKSRGLTVSVAESCTCGLLASRIGNVPGASAIFKEGYITYSNEAKTKLLKVKRSEIKRYGAVSSDVATSMAYGVKKVSKADVGIAVTGIAGPDGGTEEKPVGRVFISVAYKDINYTFKYLFEGDRQSIREQACQKALSLALYVIKDYKEY